MITKSSLFGSAANGPVLAQIRVNEIEPDPNQPRKHFDKDALKELAATIKEKGLIQPIIVRTKEGGSGYTIIAGERRWRAMKMLGAETIDAVVRDELDAKAASLIENIQRQNLKPVEEADAIAHLIEEQNLSQGAVATMLGMSRPAINGLLKIRSLPDEVKQESLALDTPKTILVELAQITDDKALKRLWKKSSHEALSVADIRRVRDAVKKGKKNVDVELTHVEKALRQAFDAIEALKGNPLTEAERARIVELQANLAALIDESATS